MLVAAHIPADDDEVHPPVTPLREVGYRLPAVGEDGEPEILELPGGESRSPGTQHVTLAGDGQPTGFPTVAFVTDAVATVVVWYWCEATDDHLAEVDREAEQRNHGSEQRQQGHRGSHPLSPELSGVNHL
jgi:hypothetical protein